MNDLDPKFLRQRRNLMAFSIAILIVSIDDADFSRATTLLGAIKLQNPSVLVYALWIGFGYSLWRYWCHQPDIRGEFWVDWQESLWKSPGLHVWKDELIASGYVVRDDRHINQRTPPRPPVSGDFRLWNGQFGVNSDRSERRNGVPRLCHGWQTSDDNPPMNTKPSIYRGFCFPAEIISHAVFLFATPILVEPARRRRPPGTSRNYRKLRNDSTLVSSI